MFDNKNIYKNNIFNTRQNGFYSVNQLEPRTVSNP